MAQSTPLQFGSLPASLPAPADLGGGLIFTGGSGAAAGASSSCPDPMLVDTGDATARASFLAAVNPPWGPASGSTTRPQLPSAPARAASGAIATQLPANWVSLALASHEHSAQLQSLVAIASSSGMATADSLGAPVPQLSAPSLGGLMAMGARSLFSAPPLATQPLRNILSAPLTSTQPSSGPAVATSAAMSRGTDPQMFVSGANKSALKPPPPGRWSGKDKDLEVKQFLKELKCHLTWYKVSEAEMGATALNFLTDKPFKMWASQLEDLQAAGKSGTWEEFSTFLFASFGSVAPDREARARYNKLRQTGTVSHYVQETRNLVRELKDSKWPVGDGELITHFIDGLKSSEQQYVEENSPPGGWSDSGDLYEKALNYEYNLSASRARRNGNGHGHGDGNGKGSTLGMLSGVRRGRINKPQAGRGSRPPVARASSTYGRGNFGRGRGRGRGLNHPSHAHIPTHEWNARLNAGRCALCKGSHHHTQCHGERDPTPIGMGF